MKYLVSASIICAMFGSTAAMSATSLSSEATAASAKITAVNTVVANVQVAKASGSTPGNYNNTSSLANVNQNFTLATGFLTELHQTLKADVINSYAYSNTPGSISATGSTLIANTEAKVYSTFLGIPALSLGITADAIGSTTTVGANSGGLYGVGSSTFTNLALSGSLFDALNFNAGLLFNPGPNTVVLALSGLTGISLILNEQIMTGNGTDTLGMTTNAVHLSFKDYLFEGKLLNGDVILGQSKALISGYSPAVPEPGTWAMMIAGFALVGSCMRRRQTRIQFA
jgi:hypothetical protein